MKITLPNGVIVEADKISYDADGNMVMTDYKTEESRRRKPVLLDRARAPELQDHVPPLIPVSKPKVIEPSADLGPAIRTLSTVQRYTYKALLQMGTVHVSSIAEELEITNTAASQRMIELIKAGVVQRVKQGVFRAVK